MKFAVSYFVIPVISGSLEKNIPRVVLNATGGNSDTYKVRCFNNKTNQLVCDGELSAIEPYEGIRQWYTEWRVEVYDQSGDLVSTDFFKVENKKVSIVIRSEALGDTLAWFPYIEEFRLKHNCEVVVSCKFSDLFQDYYPNLKLFPYEHEISKSYAQFVLGFAWDSNPVVHPQPIHSIPLQQVASDILGLQFEELKPKIQIPNDKSPILDKYVCISEYVSGQLDNWTENCGWQKVVDYLNSQGYKVVAISLEPATLNGVVDKTGCSLIEAVTYLSGAEFYIGGSTGLSWLSWAVGCQVFMINVHTPVFHEFQEDCVHLSNPDYPINKLCMSTDEMREAQKHPVSPALVIEAIDKYIKNHEIT